MPPTPLTTTPEILALLQELHTKSLNQESAVDWSSLPAQCTDEFDSIMLDKFIALDQDKCELVYHILRSTNAKTVVEAGTSFGVSTIYLALAVAENAKRAGSGIPRVIATEKEASKAKLARGHWASAGKEVENVIDLSPFWTPLALPALKLVQPNLRPGAVIIADNTIMAGDKYTELFAYVDAEGSGFRRVTLPYNGGMDMIVYQ
ncbi:hypothetical protein MYU51_012101 [Penicillium brevicompactum]|uniref:uncharacterized protein n=1 Tax=Penicillium brevicompactum TaxID=5074 RepID=UPI002541C7C2|nr:uncharacterized protein N7506_002445 [Penicillium brevicompactum]KAJ5344080.1 hypothetical protein N7506_002445 [Penicillium brevicompactum]